jgi:hypothetical protein
MSIAIEAISFDCTNAVELAGFWAAALNRQVDADGNEYFASVGKTEGASPVLMFLQVPEPRNGKNRLHLDLATADWAAEIDRLVSLGAKRLDEYDEYGIHWVTLADPEGNVFDLAELH